MISLFRRTKILSWELESLVAIFEALPATYHAIKEQISEGLLRRVFIGSSVFPNYVGFSYNGAIAKKYEDRRGPFFKLSQIQVFDLISNDYVELQIFITNGLICGYSTPLNKKVKFKVGDYNIGDYKRVAFENDEFNKLKKILSKEEIQRLNSVDVYEVVLSNSVYYHIRDLEDGDFIGMDLKRNIYRITHDPFRIEKLDQKLGDVLSPL